MKGKNKNEHINDVVMAEQTKGSDTRFHRYGQDVGAFVDIIKRFTASGDLVCDPFCGGGTTGVACLFTERKFLGIDVDGECILQAEKRLKRI